MTLERRTPSALVALSLAAVLTLGDAASFRSLGRNTPFDGWNLHGGVAATMVGGRTVYVNTGLPQAAVFGDDRQ